MAPRSGNSPRKPPARKRDWDALSPAYRTRLGNAGISRRDYNRGVSLERARGHSQTPEHPERAYKPKNVGKYEQYRARKAGPEGVADASVDWANVRSILARINDASDQEARGPVRRIIDRQNGPTQIAIANQLGIYLAIPGYNSLPYEYRVAMAQDWLHAFMTHARAASDPYLAGTRLHLVDQYNGLIAEAQRRGYDISQDRKHFFTEFKRAYAEFFNQGRVPGAQ